MIKFIKNLFKPKNYLQDFDYLEYKKDLEATNKLLQKLENNKIKREVTFEAQRRFYAYLDSPIIKIGDKEFRNHIFIANPNIHGIMIYDDETAIYKNINVMEEVRKEYKQLLDEYNKEWNDNKQ